jgi:hypothetical protein
MAYWKCGCNCKAFAFSGVACSYHVEPREQSKKGLIKVGSASMFGRLTEARRPKKLWVGRDNAGARPRILLTDVDLSQIDKSIAEAGIQMEVFNSSARCSRLRFNSRFQEHSASRKFASDKVPHAGSRVFALRHYSTADEYARSLFACYERAERAAKIMRRPGVTDLRHSEMITIAYGRGGKFLLPREDARQFAVFDNVIADTNPDEVPIPPEVPCKAETLHNIVHLLHTRDPKELDKLSNQELLDLIALCNFLDCSYVLNRASSHAAAALNRMNVKEMRKFFNLEQ